MAKAKEIDARHYDVILAPHITEKSTLLAENNATVFKVAGDAPSRRSRKPWKRCSAAR